MKKIFTAALSVILIINCFMYADAEEKYIYSEADKAYVPMPIPEKAIALTFDDGPHNKYTRMILDVLEEKNVKATFFVVGNRIELMPDIIKRIHELDCELGNHTYSHSDLSQLNNEQILEELRLCNEAVHKITGIYPKTFRPPLGKIKSRVYENIPMQKILWTIDSKDWQVRNVEKILRNIKSKVKEGSIILMHDFYDASAKALPAVIDELRELGYTFVTVSELLDIA